MALFRVRFQYAWTVEAPTKHEAYRQAVSHLKKSPETAIGSIELAELAGSKPLWKRLITGR